jgi:tetratricopeptide (TPR) repeat protein
VRTQQLFDILVAAGGLDSDDAFGDPALLGEVLLVIALNQRWFGTLEQAESFLHRAERLLAGRDERLARAEALRGMGRLHLNRKDYESAQEAFEQALALADGEGAAATRTRLYIGLGQTHVRRDDWSAALTANDRAIANVDGVTAHRRGVMGNANRRKRLDHPGYRGRYAEVVSRGASCP